MEHLLDSIDTHFPFANFRPGQRRAIEKAVMAFFDSGKKYFILEGPPGTGKSVIAYTIAQLFNRSYYITATKILQDQLVSDFGGVNFQDLKGRNAYECTYWDMLSNNSLPPGLSPRPKPKRYVNCAEGACKLEGESKLPVCIPSGGPPLCPYFAQVFKTQKARVAVMNFHSFLYQTAFTKQFDNRELLIVDEAHNAEPNLMSFISLSLNDGLFDKIKFPKLKTAAEYGKFLRETDIEEIIKSKIRLATYAGNVRDADDWNNILTRYRIFINADEDQWISSYKSIRHGAARIIELKPLFVREYANKYLFNKADHVMLMSATILDAYEMSDALGIDKKDMFAYKMSSRFPVENRPITMCNVGSMSYKNKGDTLPHLLEEAIEICRSHEGERGIIHTHNFEIADLIYQEAPNDVSKRLKYQKSFKDKNVLLEHHAKEEGSIIIAPAMHEGLDLKDELARFAIICKVPYPALGNNPQLKARMEVSPNYYTWLTALKLIQSYGRAIRSEEDWAATYILDSDIGWFLKRADKIIPKWFKDAIQK